MSPFSKLTSPCQAWESCQVPEEKTSVCFHCGWRKRDHKMTRQYHETLFQELHFQLERELTINPTTLKIGELHWANRKMIEHLSRCPNGPDKVLEARRVAKESSNCSRCASVLKDGLCTDVTCPYSDHPQSWDYETNSQ